IVQRLKVTFPWREKPLVKTGTPNLEAYQSYLKGHALLYRRGPAIFAALACCQRAVELDPNYALAWADLANCYTCLCWYGFATPQASIPKAVDAARRAVARDPSLSETHCALAIATLVGVWDNAEAEREFLRALELNPKNIQARIWHACFFLQLCDGRLTDGMKQAKLALATDPLSGYTHAMYALTCIIAGKTGDGITAGRHAVEFDGESFLARWVLQAALLLSGEFDASIVT